VSVSDGILDLTLDDLGGNNQWVVLMALEVEASGPLVTNIAVDDVSQPEGSTGDTTTFTFTVSLEDQLGSPATLSQDVTVELSTRDVSAVASSDYTAISGQAVTITAGTSSTTFNVEVNSDDTEEADETFEVTLTNALQGGIADATLAIGDQTGIGTIKDDDTPPPAFDPLYLDFGKSNSPLADGYTRVSASDTWDGVLGWQPGAINLNDFDRSIGSDLHRDFNYLESGTFSVALPNGTYDISVTLGDTDTKRQAHELMGVFLEGTQVDSVTTSPGEVVNNTYTVSVNDGILDLMLDDLGGSNKWVMLIALEVADSGTTIIVPTPLSESSVSDNSPTDTNEGYQLKSRSLASKVADVATSHAHTDSTSTSTNNPTDLFPDNPELTTLSDYINYIADYIADDNVIFAEDWKEQDHNTQFTADLETILELVFAAEAAEAADQAAFLYLQAFEMVDEKLIPRTDGFQEGGSPETDWIIIKEAQDIIYPDLILLSEYLWLSAH